MANQCSTDKLNLKEKIKDVENKIASISDLVAISVFHAKIGEVQNEVYVTSNLVTTNVPDKNIRVKSKIPVFSDLVKKMNHNTKISNNKRTVITNSDCNKFMCDIPDAKINEK